MISWMLRTLRISDGSCETYEIVMIVFHIDPDCIDRTKLEEAVGIHLIWSDVRPYGKKVMMYTTHFFAITVSIVSDVSDSRENNTVYSIPSIQKKHIPRSSEKSSTIWWRKIHGENSSNHPWHLMDTMKLWQISTFPSQKKKHWISDTDGVTMKHRDQKHKDIYQLSVFLMISRVFLMI